MKVADNYCIAHANTLETNVSIYYLKNQRRKTIKYSTAPDNLPKNKMCGTLLKLIFKAVILL